ncbi:MAG: glycoside hydrolase family 32 protein [Bacteroidales bacterium]|nr:glycoside hydrolase family 32 protein [Bacteroidales bacterium]
MNMTSYRILSIAACCIMMQTGCKDDSGTTEPIDINNSEATDTTTQVEKPNLYTDKYRPQVHFTPAKNWMNDPNGMVYDNGTWHLFYQYNPYANNWGNMSWGHATSTDLIHWNEQDVALTRDKLGDIFSGSAVIDHEGTAGFGKDAMVCLYTSSGSRQQQSMAYSTDHGKTFNVFAGNPIIANTDKDDFRDPKVFWHADSKQWIMSLARGWQYAIDFYASNDLKSWHFLSSFNTPEYVRCNKGQWECPDLIKLGDKWVLIVSTNPGGPVSGSGTMYFIGDFDGEQFVADPSEYPMWLDYGMDNYAGVTWSNTGDRKVLIGWMNNWNYAGDVPCDPWRSAMTLPRELSLTNIDGNNYLCSKVVGEIDAIASDWKAIDGNLPSAQAYHVKVTVDMASNHTIQLANGQGEHFDIDVKGVARLLIARRNAQTGASSFNGSFSIPAAQAPIRSAASELTIDIFIDRSSVEVITEDGTTSLTNLVFPSSIYNAVKVDGNANIGSFRTLEGIWK